MQPARQDLPVVPGTTYRDTVRLMQPDFAYRPITSIAGAPAHLLVPGHGLTADWPVWVRGVRGLSAINREPPQALPHRAVFKDSDTLEINAVSAAGFTSQGGELLYRLPIDLTGAAVSMRFTDTAGGELLELSLGEGLAFPSPGTITRVLTATQTELLVGAWRYVLEVTFADDSVTRYFEGGRQVAGGCCG